MMLVFKLRIDNRIDLGKILSQVDGLSQQEEEDLPLDNLSDFTEVEEGDQEVGAEMLIKVKPLRVRALGEGAEDEVVSNLEDLSQGRKKP